MFSIPESHATSQLHSIHYCSLGKISSRSLSQNITYESRGFLTCAKTLDESYYSCGQKIPIKKSSTLRIRQPKNSRKGPPLVLELYVCTKLVNGFILSMKSLEMTAIEPANMSNFKWPCLYKQFINLLHRNTQIIRYLIKACRFNIFSWRWSGYKLKQFYRLHVNMYYSMPQ